MVCFHQTTPGTKPKRLPGRIILFLLVLINNLFLLVILSILIFNINPFFAVI